MRLLILVAISLACQLAGSRNCAAQLRLEFLDDFAKSVEEYRDPYEERIETERHDFTQSATTVGHGVFQIESGYSYFSKQNEHEKENAHTYPEMLVRLGLSEDIEFRLRWHYVWIYAEDEPSRIGSEDLRDSLKFQLTREEEPSLMPTTALEVRGSAPTGGNQFTTNHAEISLDYIYLWQLGERVTVTGSTGYGSNGFGDFGLLPDQPTAENFNALSQSVALGVELSEKNTLYTEWYTILSNGLEDDFVVSVFNMGLDHYVTDNFVLDIRGGIGLTEESDDFFVGVGGGYRF